MLSPNNILPTAPSHYAFIPAGKKLHPFKKVISLFVYFTTALILNLGKKWECLSKIPALFVSALSKSA